MRLGGLMDVAYRIAVIREKTPSLFATADIITNSGHVRPITGDRRRLSGNDAVVSLMFEKWEIRRQDRIGYGLTCWGAEFGLAGTNERHPDVDVFSYLGLMAAAQLADAGVSAYRSEGRACSVTIHFSNTCGRGWPASAPTSLPPLIWARSSPDLPDALIVANDSGSSAIPALSAEDIDALARYWPGVIVCQFWGDVDRAASGRPASISGHCRIRVAGTWAYSPHGSARNRLSGCKPADSRWARYSGYRRSTGPRMMRRGWMSSPKRVVLIGMGSTAESALAALLDRFRVVGLVREAGPRTGRSGPPTKAAPRSSPMFRSHAVRRIIADTGPDCVVVSSLQSDSAGGSASMSDHL